MFMVSWFCSLQSYRMRLELWRLLKCSLWGGVYRLHTKSGFRGLLLLKTTTAQLTCVAKRVESFRHTKAKLSCHDIQVMSTSTENAGKCLHWLPISHKEYHLWSWSWVLMFYTSPHLPHRVLTLLEPLLTYAEMPFLVSPSLHKECMETASFKES